MRPTAAATLVLLGAGLAGCGSDDPQPVAIASSQAPAAELTCREGGLLTEPLPTGWRRASLSSGPLTLLYGRQLADQRAGSARPTRRTLRRLIAAPATTPRERRLARRTLRHTAPGSFGVAEAFVVVDPNARVTLSVAPSQRSRVGLVYSARARGSERRGAAGAYRVADADSAVTFRGCRAGPTHFLGGIVVAGARCVRLTVTAAGRPAAELPVPFAGAKCVRREAAGPGGRLLFAQRPYMGVACPKPNSIACDRIGLAVWLRRPAAQVTATINGQRLDLDGGRRTGRPPVYWEGYLQPAGLLSGPLKVRPDRGLYHWTGEHPRSARLAITVRRAGGAVGRVSLVMPLRAGWG
jgi:hypothetical protein